MDFNGLNRLFTIIHTSVRFNTIQRKISGICEICVRLFPYKAGSVGVYSKLVSSPRRYWS